VAILISFLFYVVVIFFKIRNYSVYVRFPITTMAVIKLYLLLLQSALKKLILFLLQSMVIFLNV